MPDPTPEQIREVKCPTCSAAPGFRCPHPGPLRDGHNHPSRIDAYLRREEARKQDPLTREIEELQREVKEWLASNKGVHDASLYGLNPSLWREAKRRGLEEAHKRHLQEAGKVERERIEERERFTQLTNELRPLRAFVEAIVEDGRDSAITMQLARFLLERPDTAF